MRVIGSNPEVIAMNEIPEINPELFIWELFDISGLSGISHDTGWEIAMYAEGWCDGKRLPCRPHNEHLGIMLLYPPCDNFPNGHKCWFHITKLMLDAAQRKLKLGHVKRAVW